MDREDEKKDEKLLNDEEERHGARHASIGRKYRINHHSRHPGSYFI